MKVLHKKSTHDSRIQSAFPCADQNTHLSPNFKKKKTKTIRRNNILFIRNFAAIKRNWATKKKVKLKVFFPSLWFEALWFTRTRLTTHNGNCYTRIKQLSINRIFFLQPSDFTCYDFNKLLFFALSPHDNDDIPINFRFFFNRKSRKRCQFWLICRDRRETKIKLMKRIIKLMPAAWKATFRGC